MHLRPRAATERIHVSLSGQAVYEELFAFRDDPDEIHRRLAYDLHRLACVGLVVEIIRFLVSIGDTLG